MTPKHPTPRLRALLAASLALIGLAGAAQATDAQARVELNVRTGPGTGYGVIDTLDAGERVEVIECNRQRWCYIDQAGPNGWVSSSYLDMRPEDRRPGRNCRLEFNLDGDGPQLSVVCDAAGGGTPPAPGPAPAPTPGGRDRVCFYDDADFAGDKFCRADGRIDQLPARFDNKISSIRVHGNVRAQVCSEPNLRGFCWVVSEDARILGPLSNNKISSVAIFSSWWGGGPAPTPAPVTYKTGPLAVQPTWMFDLDEGLLSVDGADMWYRVINGTTRRLAPRNGAKIAVGDGSNRGLAGCRAAAFDTTSIRIEDLAIGTYVCVQTSEGRISQFRVNRFDGGTMQIGFTTWAN